MIQIHDDAKKMLEEEPFKLFKHEGLICCVQRIGWSGVLNGYASVPADHPLFGKDYGDNLIIENPAQVDFNGNVLGLFVHALSNKPDNMLSLDLAIQVHGGLTYSRDYLPGIENGLFSDLWWFGFDTMHLGDLVPYQRDVDRMFPSRGGEYRDMDYVTHETKKLAEQLKAFQRQ